MKKAKRYPVEVHVEFDLTKLSRNKRDCLRDAEDNLKAVAQFDTGPRMVKRPDDLPEHKPVTREWEFDWSLKGPVTITASGKTRAVLAAVEGLMDALRENPGLMDVTHLVEPLRAAWEDAQESDDA